jgi:mannose-6-phosphate isomerase-like protein (cupin superfamily)
LTTLRWPPDRRGLMVCETMDDKINLAAKFALLDQPYQPGIVGFINDYKLQVVKVKGPFVWHKHDETDDFFLVISGHLTIHLRDRDIELDPGELFVVPRGVEHCPDAAEETLVLLIEPDGTPNTGNAGGSMTAEPRRL